MYIYFCAGPKLGFVISERSVSRYIRRTSPSDQSRKLWAAFLRNHREAITAMAFITDTIGNRLPEVSILFAFQSTSILARKRNEDLFFPPTSLQVHARRFKRSAPKCSLPQPYFPGGLPFGTVNSGPIGVLATDSGSFVLCPLGKFDQTVGPVNKTGYRLVARFFRRMVKIKRGH